MGEEVEDEQTQDHHDRQGPFEGGYLHAGSGAKTRFMTAIMPDLSVLSS
ncbi:hypothetical protein [Nocardia pseudovaccinii]|nr:hypothetical protein [Nocardia pseudovaccinii]